MELGIAGQDREGFSRTSSTPPHEGAGGPVTLTQQYLLSSHPPTLPLYSRKVESTLFLEEFFFFFYSWCLVGVEAGTPGRRGSWLEKTAGLRAFE